MVIKIHKSAAQTASSLLYNTKKVDRDVAFIVCVENAGNADVKEMARIFEARERLAVRDVMHSSFQMSVNPGEEDTFKEEDLPDLVRDIMEGLGYAGQPWIVFRHDDTGRTHYHVVSTRINAQGRKINDYYEKRRCRDIALSLGPRYGFVLGSGKKKRRSKMTHPRYVHGKTPLTETAAACVQHALTYRFPSPEAFADVMRTLGLEVTGVDSIPEPRYVIRGIGKRGRGCTPPVPRAFLPADLEATVEEKARETLAAGLDIERERAAEMLDEAARAGSLRDAARILRGMGADLVLIRDETKMPERMVLVDHGTRCAFDAYGVARIATNSLLELARQDDNKKLERELEKEQYEEKEAEMNAVDIAASLLDAIGSGDQSNSKDLREKRKRIKF